MAITLAARGTWPGPSCYDVEPTLDHLREHVNDVNQAHHYLLAYMGHRHVGQVFGRWTTGFLAARGTCRSVTQDPVFETPLTYLIRPRQHAIGLRYLVIVTSDGGATVNLTVLETGVTTSIAVAAGALVVGQAIDGAVNRGGLWTTVQVDLAIAPAPGAGKYVDLMAIGIADDDLAVGSLP